MIKIPLIDRDSCTLCGACVAECPKRHLSISDGAVRINTGECMLCSHCFCVCPSDSISFDPKSLKELSFQEIKPAVRMISGPAEAGRIAAVIHSRRSVRKYGKKNPSRKIISDLLEIAVSAPSGSNRQQWEFIVISGREKVMKLAMKIRDFFIAMNRIADNPVLLALSFILAGKKLFNYKKNHIESVKMALQEFKKGNDLLFHGAPSLLIIHGPTEGSTPLEDSVLASYNIVLIAHSIGLGTCYIGYAVESINRSKKIKRDLGIPPGNRVHVVLSIGYPVKKHIRRALRKPYRTNWV